jgi:hypothetical protein
MGREYCFIIYFYSILRNNETLELIMDIQLLNDIKFNCDVSDAQFWGYFSVCGLLMRYRDLFRSERGLKPWAEINREEIMSWISSKESRWPELEAKDFRDLTIAESSYGPFDVVEVNRALQDRNLVYGAGYGMYMKPTFFLAELRSRTVMSDLTVYTSGTELIRDLFTAPGMLQEKSIYLRLEPLTMLLLYKVSERNARSVSALEDAFAQYGFQHRQIIDETFEKRLGEMAEQYSEILLCHEIAEALEEVPEWKIIISRAGDRKVEHYLRAIKDLIADTSDHGPYKRIVDLQDRGALSLSIALIDGYRLVMYPEMQNAYNEFSRYGNWSAIDQSRRAGYEHFRAQRDAIVELFHVSGGKDDFTKKIRERMLTI